MTLWALAPWPAGCYESESEGDMLNMVTETGSLSTHVSTADMESRHVPRTL